MDTILIFSSATFLFIFLPLFLAAYTLFSFIDVRLLKGRNRRFSNGFILLTSLFFYAWGERLIVLVLLLSTTVDYIAGLLISGTYGRNWKGEVAVLPVGGSRTRMQTAGLIISVITNLAALGFFKYFNFFIDNFYSAAVFFGLDFFHLDSVIRIALPMGISFYTFQSMSYTIDVYRGEIPATKDFLGFACFISMFPQLVAGPIVRYRHIAQQLKERFVDVEDFSYGIRRFSVGLAKKVIFGDYFALIVDRIFALPINELGFGTAWLGAICFSLQLYYDFSGYSDMAIGLGRMLGFKFNENFNYPYLSTSFREYWTRWHISLATWFRDYLYYSLGGSRVSAGRLYFNLLTVFILCGLWHGASWTFIAWGLMHGFFIVIERNGWDNIILKLWKPLQYIYFNVVSLIVKTMFRSVTFEQFYSFLRAMFGFSSPVAGATSIWNYLNTEVLIFIFLAAIGTAPVIPYLRNKLLTFGESRGEPASHIIRIAVRATSTICIVLLLLLSTMWMSVFFHKPFVYFRF